MRIVSPLSLLCSLALLGCAAEPPAGAALVATSARPAAGAQAPADLPARLLAAHNRERALVGVPPLAWDAQLAADAASYGPALAALGRLDHSPRAGRPGQSENLWTGTAGAYSPEQMVESWTREKAWFRPGVFPDVSSTGNWLDVSHYTLMIWRSTARVGCAVHRSTAWDYLICRYSPRGNIDGQRVP